MHLFPLKSSGNLALNSDAKFPKLKFNYIIFFFIYLPLHLSPIYENAGCALIVATQHFLNTL